MRLDEAATTEQIERHQTFTYPDISLAIFAARQSLKQQQLMIVDACLKSQYATDDEWERLVHRR